MLRPFSRNAPKQEQDGRTVRHAWNAPALVRLYLDWRLFRLANAGRQIEQRDEENSEQRAASMTPTNRCPRQTAARRAGGAITSGIIPG